MEDWDDWIIGYRYRAKGYREVDPAKVPLMVRCPSHITRWAMQVSMTPTTVNALQRVAAAKERDRERLEHNPDYGQHEPYMLPEVLERIGTG